MDETTVSEYIRASFPGVETASTGPYTFFYYGSDRKLPFATLDRLLPHPVYAPQSWAYVLSPNEETFRTVQPLLSEAYDRAVKRAKRMASADD